MKIEKDRIIERINQLLSDNERMTSRQDPAKFNPTMLEKTIFGTISILDICYGENSQRAKSVLELRTNYIKAPEHFKYKSSLNIQSLVDGVLNTLKSDISFNFLTTLENQVAGEIYGDLISLAKKLIESNHKEPAAVLACGALEDSMKKLAIKNGLDIYEADLTTVVNSLKSKGLIKGIQAGVVQSYVRLRNKTFHAQFENIEAPEIVSLISFVEQFIIENF